MAKFTEDQTCVKCGYYGYHIKWDATLEVLDVQCVRCGYTWMCRPLDYQDDKKSNG